GGGGGVRGGGGWVGAGGWDVRGRGGKAMVWRPWLVVLSLVACMCPLAVSSAQTAPTLRPEGTLTVAVATFGNERWLPELYPGAEDAGPKPLMANPLRRGRPTRRR